MKLSIVATLYQSAAYVADFHRRASTAAQQLCGEDYEIVLVNDGSPDDSLNIAVGLTQDDTHLMVIDLSRNFGHRKAMMTGLANSRGEMVFLIDSDLEEEPEWLLSFAEQMANDKCDVVYGVQAQRKGGFFERWSGQWLYRIFSIFAGMKLPENVATARLMTRRYVDALVSHEEREVFMAGLWQITGFTQVSKTINKKKERKTTYNLRNKISLSVNYITSFSNRSLIAIFYIGILFHYFLLSIFCGLCSNGCFWLDRWWGGPRSWDPFGCWVEW